MPRITSPPGAGGQVAGPLARDRLPPDAVPERTGGRTGAAPEASLRSGRQAVPGQRPLNQLLPLPFIRFGPASRGRGRRPLAGPRGVGATRGLGDIEAVLASVCPVPPIGASAQPVGLTVV